MTFSSPPAVPKWKFTDDLKNPAPLETSRRYLAIYHKVDIYHNAVDVPNFGRIMRFANLPKIADLNFVNGYNSMQPQGMKSLLGFEWTAFMYEQDSERILRMETGKNGLLDWMSVDGLVVGKTVKYDPQRLQSNGWKLFLNTSEGAVYHRDVPLPQVRSATVASTGLSIEHAALVINSRDTDNLILFLTQKKSDFQFENHLFSPLFFQSIHTSANTVEAQTANFSPTQTGLAVFSRAWVPGYRAFLNGKETGVEVVNGLFPAVRVPAGFQGSLALVYRPRSFELGLWISALTAIGLATLRILRHSYQRR